MSKHSIAVKRNGVTGFLSDQSIGTDAINALSKIAGVSDIEIISEAEDKALLSYTWSGSDTFWETNEHLNKFGLTKVEDS